MKHILIALAVFFSPYIGAQEITYSISCPPGARSGMGMKALPSTIDTSHYYSTNEIKELAEPMNGWSDFYELMDSLDYPLAAKKKKLQSAMTVEFKIDENGNIDQVSISSFESSGRWDKCAACEELIIAYFRNTKWTPGKIRETSVKTVDFAYVLFEIHDPNSKEPKSVFGY